MLSDMESKVYGRVRGVKHFVDHLSCGAIDNSVILSEAEGPPRRRREPRAAKVFPRCSLIGENSTTSYCQSE